MIGKEVPEKTKGAAPDQENAPFATTFADHTGDLLQPKTFVTLHAKFALVGLTLYRSVNADGGIVYVAGRWGYLRELKSLEAVAAFLAVIGGVK